MSPTIDITRESWRPILASAVAIFEDLETRGFGCPDVVIGGGTVLMFRFERLANSCGMPKIVDPSEIKKTGHHTMTKPRDPAAIAMSAIENVSRIPVTREDIRRMLATGSGEPSHVMALFSDVDYAVLLRLAIVFDISDADLARAYVGARDIYAAANADMDDFVLEMEAVARSAGPGAGGQAS
jgi:hypothetical protein